MKTKILLSAALAILMTIGCSKKDDVAAETAITADEATVSSKLDITNDDVSKIIEEQFAISNGFSNKSNVIAKPFLPSCATVNIYPQTTAALKDGDVVTINIDFGTTGCALPNGNVLKGKIKITYTYNALIKPQTATYEFIDFYHNAIKVEGKKTFTRTMTVATATSVSHPIVDIDIDITATFPDGRVFTRIGKRTREIIEGYDTQLDYTDNVYQITGNWTTTYPNTTAHKATITKPLIVKLNCANIVAGIITFERNTKTATLDYGNGDCDNQAIFTKNGFGVAITLRN